MKFLFFFTVSQRKRPSLVQMMGVQRSTRVSARTKMGQKWLAKVKKGQVAPKGNGFFFKFIHLNLLLVREIF